MVPRTPRTLPRMLSQDHPLVAPQPGLAPQDGDAASKQAQASLRSARSSSPSSRGSRLWSALTASVASILGATVLASSLLVQPAQARRFDAEPAVRTDAVVGLSSLPVQAQDVYRRILSGGPFRYDKDGTVFGNRERILPREPRGFYREYTVPTPGERDRGARRIVCGGKDTRQPETCFYTQDHYQSFRPIDPRR
jgi:ribonuclease T1